ncbi:putative mRNA-decapping enzyme subunit 1, PH domain-containing protein [Medicago truncatula]|uniref:Putative mRNA-decapping enzyme subunit 1, PH domain-containing protein n=1 Tax=Medicago truncatula TaxID=3880 RepID=A0A396H7E9_MEDTR|nr:putative mRNA-decapping enzyme subunit 1, PH domain-containing protein [Medicago truncatula]
MSQTKKLTPNLDQHSTKMLNLTVLQRMDPFIDEILFTAAHVSFYDFNIETNQWSRKDVEGSLFVVKRNAQPRFQFIVMNRRNTDNLVENLLDFEYELKKPYLLYRNASQEVNGIWFYNPEECEEVANLFNRILNAYPKALPNATMSSNKSEFEEHDQVSAINESAIETSSAAVAATDAVEDSVFTNFFNTCKITGPYASNVESFHQPYHSASVTSTVPGGFLSPVPSIQIPSTSLETINSGTQLFIIPRICHANTALRCSNPSHHLIPLLLLPPFPALCQIDRLSAGIKSAMHLYHWFRMINSLT